VTTIAPLARAIRDHANGGPTMPAVYTVAQVAELLGLSTTSTYGLVREGAIPARKLGGRWVIPRQRFHDWLNELADSPPAAVPARHDPAPTGRRWA
jgi:excisionase family DNA binding protein